jgi:hypothetical protein
MAERKNSRLVLSSFSNHFSFVAHSQVLFVMADFGFFLYKDVYNFGFLANDLGISCASFFV